MAVIAVVTGLGLMVTPFAWSLFDRTADAERILDRFEFLTLDGNPARYLAEAETTRSGSTELVEEAIPSLASDAGVDQGELDRLAQARFPALTAARTEIPKANRFSVRYSSQLDAVDRKFGSAYDVPTSSLSLTATPWLLLSSGLLCLVAGVVALRTTGPMPVVAILTLGSAMALGSLAVGAPGKAAAGEDVKDFASRGLTARAAAAAREASGALDGLVRETNQETLPYLARRRGSSQSQLDQEMRRRFPAAAKLLAEWDGIGPRLSRLAEAVTRSVDEFESVKRMPISPPVWWLMCGGLAMSLASGLTLLRERRRRRTPVAPAESVTDR